MLEGIHFETPNAQLVFNERLRQLDESRQRQARLLRQMQQMASEETKIAQVIGLLQTIPGVGFLTAMLLATELIDIGRFKTADDLVAFIGLMPQVHESDEQSYPRGLSNRRNAELRSRLIEAAWTAARKRCLPTNHARAFSGQSDAEARENLFDLKNSVFCLHFYIKIIFTVLAVTGLTLTFSEKHIDQSMNTKNSKE